MFQSSCPTPTPVAPVSSNRHAAQIRGALAASIAVHGTQIVVVNTHLGLGRGERIRQVEELLGPAWLGHPEIRDRPTVLTGDFNAVPTAPPTAGWHSIWSRCKRDRAAGKRSRFPPGCHSCGSITSSLTMVWRSWAPKSCEGDWHDRRRTICRCWRELPCRSIGEPGHRDTGPDTCRFAPGVSAALREPGACQLFEAATGILTSKCRDRRKDNQNREYADRSEINRTSPVGLVELDRGRTVCDLLPIGRARDFICNRSASRFRIRAQRSGSGIGCVDLASSTPMINIMAQFRGGGLLSHHGSHSSCGLCTRTLLRGACIVRIIGSLLLACPPLLVRDRSTSDPVAGVSGRLTFIVIRARVDDERGAVIIEQCRLPIAQRCLV